MDGREIIRNEIKSFLKGLDVELHSTMDLRLKAIEDRLMKLEGGAVIAGTGLATDPAAVDAAIARDKANAAAPKQAEATMANMPFDVN